MRQHYLFAERIPHMVWVAEPGGDAYYFNRRCEEYTGLSYQLLGQGWRQVIHPDDLPSTLERWARALATGRPYEVQYRLRRADGTYHWHIGRAEPQFDERGQPVGWVGTCTDVEEQKRAEQQLAHAHRRTAESLALLDTFIDNAPVGFALLDTELRYVRVNPALAAINGLPAAAHLGRHLWDVIPRLWPTLEACYRQLLRGECPTGVVEVSGETAAEPGRTRHWLTTHYPVYAGSGLLGIGAIVSEVTEWKRLKEQFLQAQKMEAVGRLAGGVAHDFNNLLTVINSYASLVLQDLAGREPAADSARAILKAGERAAGLTRQLLAFSRKQIVAPRVLDLNVLVAEAEAMLRPLLGEEVVLTVDLQPGLAPVRSDPSQLQQVVLNLAVNARDAMPQGGRLSVLTRDVGDYVLLEVSDTGYGMTEEVQAHLFEPFFTTKEKGEGTGLGLSTVYGIVKQAGGHIEVESQRGAGTIVRVYLPRTSEAPAEEKPEGAGPAPRGTETVLLAEDEDSVRALVREVLQSAGYAVLQARDGAEALWLADQHRGLIHLLVTDVVMPGLDGRGLAERLGGRHPDLKVLYLSGHTDDALVRHGVSQEQFHFLQKPFSPAALTWKVREVLDAEA